MYLKSWSRNTISFTKENINTQNFPSTFAYFLYLPYVYKTITMWPLNMKADSMWNLHSHMNPNVILSMSLDAIFHWPGVRCGHLSARVCLSYCPTAGCAGKCIPQLWLTVQGLFQPGLQVVCLSLKFVSPVKTRCRRLQLKFIISNYMDKHICWDTQNVIYQIQIEDSLKPWLK